MKINSQNFKKFKNNNFKNKLKGKGNLFNKFLNK